MTVKKFEILGHRLILSSERGEGYLKEISEFVSDKIENSLKLHPDTLKAVLIACIEIAEELYSEREKLLKLKEELGRKIDSAIKEIENES